MMILTGTEQLQELSKSLLSDGKQGAKIFRKGLRAGAKVIAERVKATYPRKTGAAVKSVKVKAIKRKKGRIGVRVGLFAESKKGFPYPMALEGGAKNQPKGVRIRKAVKRITVGGVSKRVTDEANSKAYHALSWRIRPRHDIRKAFDASQGRASDVIIQTFLDEISKVSVK